MFRRITSPSAKNPFYIAREYGGYNKYTLIINKETGAVIPNCTAFCFGAFMECAQIKTCNLPVANAGNWWALATYDKGQTPKAGAVACWSGGTNDNGHVAFVNEVKADGTIVVAESGYYSKIWFMETTLKPPYNRSGLTFQGFIYNPFVETEKIKIKGGKQVYTYQGAEIVMLGQRDSWHVGMVSAQGADPHTAVQDITRLDYDGAIIMGKMNANYFQMRHDQPDPYGEHYGTEYSFTNEFAPHKGNVLAYALMADGKSAVCVPDNEFYYDRTAVAFACAPAVVPYVNGDYVNLHSPAFVNSKIEANTQSMFIRTNERCALAVCTGKMTVGQLTDWAANNIDGLQDLLFMDSGGSSQIVIGYDATVYTGRLIPNALCFYEPKHADTGGTGAGGTVDRVTQLTAENEALRSEIDGYKERLKKIAELATEGAKI